ncbi:hypothetical protein ACXGR8_35410, partial [Nocardia gipuzkoensis]
MQAPGAGELRHVVAAIQLVGDLVLMAALAEQSREAPSRPAGIADGRYRPAGAVVYLLATV